MKFLNLIGLAVIVSITLVSYLFNSCNTSTVQVLKDTIDERGLHSVILIYDTTDTVACDYLTQDEYNQIINVK